MDPARVFAILLLACLALWGLLVLAGWAAAWWRMRQADKAMDRVSARLRCTWVCSAGHTYSWPCERSVLGDQRCRRCRSGVAR